MSIKTFIKSRLRDRIKQNNVLVVYDSDKRYHDLCLELSSEEIHVIDASESSIESRETAIQSLMELGKQNSKIKGMLIYIPAKAPMEDEEKQRDPFSLYMVCGRVFPDPEIDSDEYLNLCLAAKPDQSTEIRRIFKANANPSFALIDALGAGTGWPNLQTLLGVESARNIILALLAPSPIQEKNLKEQESWLTEAKELLTGTIGLNLVTRSKSWSKVREELWRFILFSEFAYDLQSVLPDSLKDVPHAKSEAMPTIRDLCETLRNDLRTHSLYIERAEEIESELELPIRCKGIKDLGTLDTFPFKERYFLEQAMDAFKNEDTDTIRKILSHREKSVWRGKGESQAQWAVIRATLSLIEVCDDHESQLSDYQSSQEKLIEYYIGSLREVDRLHRELEQAVGDYLEFQGTMREIIELARRKYYKLTNKVQDLFIRHIEKSGWPPVGRMMNADLFDVVIAPLLQESGRRVAFFQIDALRYELGVALEKEISEVGQTELRAAFAQLPSITKVGMASLLPDAGKKLVLKRNDKGELFPMLGEFPVTDVKQRMDVLRKRYGQRFQEMHLTEFMRSRKSIPNTVELLVIRSERLDNKLEGDTESSLNYIHELFKHIRVAINKLEKIGFNDVVIATDHGFVLNAGAEAGSVATKPQGEWINLHERSLLGKGAADSANFVLPAEQVGIRGDFEYLAGPRGLVSYRTGMDYFHGGISLQEIIVPVITVRYKDKKPGHLKPTVNLSYKNGAKRITTRLPVMELLLEYYDLFEQEASFEILLEAHDKTGNVVGEAKAGGPVNPATGTITLKPGERVQIAMKMNPEFEGEFTVKALNPTTLSTYSKLDLETNYMV